MIRSKKMLLEDYINTATSEGSLSVLYNLIENENRHSFQVSLLDEIADHENVSREIVDRTIINLIKNDLVRRFRGGYFKLSPKLIEYHDGITRKTAISLWNLRHDIVVNSIVE